MLLAILMITGCMPTNVRECQHACDLIKNASRLYEDYKKTIEQNPCGILYVRRPLINVTGHLAGSPPDNTTIHLYILPNLSISATQYVLGHCPPIGRRELNASQFSLGPLPVGRYLLVIVPGASSAESVIPMIAGTHNSGLLVQSIYAGRIGKYPIALFSVRSANQTSIDILVEDLGDR